MAITVDISKKTEQEALASMADVLRNPPKNPVAMINWVSKNFTVAGDLMGSLGKALGLSKALPVIGEIFGLFTSFTAPSVGEQIMQAVSQITNVIQAGVEEVKNAIQFSTEKTISAISQEIQSVSAEESAVRVINNLIENDLVTNFTKESQEMFSSYTKAVTDIEAQWQKEILDEIAAANAEVQAQYEKIQELLASLGIDFIKDLYDLYLKANQSSQNSATKNTPTKLPAAVVEKTVPEETAKSSSIIFILAGVAAFYIIYKKS